jgi:hypothetical protein
VTNVPRAPEGASSSCPDEDLCDVPLDQALEAGAKGLYTSEAGVALVVAHRHWLTRQDFVDALVVDDDEDGSMAWIEWDDVVDFLEDHPASSGEAALLLIAASLAGARVGEPLGHLVSKLDLSNLELVLDAVAHANGLHERHTTLTICGDPGAP